MESRLKPALKPHTVSARGSAPVLGALRGHTSHPSQVQRKLGFAVLSDMVAT